MSYTLNEMENSGSLKKMVYDTLLDDITSGKFRPNDIITEGSLTERFGVSKAPVREALIELCKDNILQSLPRFGYQVVPFTLREILDILNVRTDIEISNLRRAFPSLTDEKLEQLSDPSLYIVAGENGGISGNYYRNSRFHLVLCSLSGNSFAYSILDSILKRCSRFFAVYYSFALNNDTESKASYHREIADALRIRDLDKAAAALEKDIASVKEHFEKIITF